MSEVTVEKKHFVPFVKEQGHFFVIEGIDRSGKTTQSLKLVANLQVAGFDAVHMRFPSTDTPIGKMIRSFLENKIDMEKHAIHLLFSADRWSQQETIKNLLKEGKIIVCDRYYPSGIAFTVANGTEMTWAVGPDKGLIEPDNIFHFELPVSEAEKRGGFGMIFCVT